MQVLDLGPVGDEHALEAERAAQQLPQQPSRRDDGHVVELVVALHDGERALTDRRAERRHVVLLQHALRQLDRRAVVARLGRRVAHEVLEARRGAMRRLLGGGGAADVGVGVGATRRGDGLNPAHHVHAHLRHDVRVLAEGLVHARPERLRGEAEDRREQPRHASRARVLGGDAAELVGERAIEGSRDVDLLRHHRRIRYIARSVHRVEPEQQRRHARRGRLLLHGAHEAAPLAHVPATLALDAARRIRRVEHGAHLEVAQPRAQSLVADLWLAVVRVLPEG